MRKLRQNNMQKITSGIELKDAIRLLEEKQAVQELVLKKEFFKVVESIKPGNILKNSFSHMVSSPYLIRNILSATTGLAAGYLSNKTFVGISANLLNNLLGKLLQAGITALNSRNPETFKSHNRLFQWRAFSKRKALS